MNIGLIITIVLVCLTAVAWSAQLPATGATLITYGGRDCYAPTSITYYPTDQCLYDAARQFSYKISCNVDAGFIGKITVCPQVTDCSGPCKGYYFNPYSCMANTTAEGILDYPQPGVMWTCGAMPIVAKFDGILMDLYQNTNPLSCGQFMLRKWIPQGGCSTLLDPSNTKYSSNGCNQTTWTIDTYDTQHCGIPTPYTESYIPLKGSCEDQGYGQAAIWRCAHADAPVL